jgi:hypothetical protein
MAFKMASRGSLEGAVVAVGALVGATVAVAGGRVAVGGGRVGASVGCACGAVVAVRALVTVGSGNVGEGVAPQAASAMARPIKTAIWSGAFFVISYLLANAI